jgi:trans-aconitate methyltransferase
VKQTWDPCGYQHNAGFVAKLGLPVLELLAPLPGERILDLGCGDGALTIEIARLGAEVVGIDSSPQMIASARERGLDARVADGQALEFTSEFDAAFTNAALHWMPDPAAVLAGVHRALRSGGRFAGEFGGFGNVASIETALGAVLRARGIARESIPRWYFPTPAAFGALLAHSGFDVRELVLIHRPTALPTGMSGWLTTFGERFFALLPEAERAAARDEAVELLRPALFADGAWSADYVRLRFSALQI